MNLRVSHRKNALKGFILASQWPENAAFCQPAKLTVKITGTDPLIRNVFYRNPKIALTLPQLHFSHPAKSIGNPLHDFLTRCGSPRSLQSSRAASSRCLASLCQRRLLLPTQLPSSFKAITFSAHYQPKSSALRALRLHRMARCFRRAMC